MIVSKEARVQTAKRKIRSYQDQRSRVRESDHITLRRVTDIEVINEKGRLRELTEQFNQIILSKRHSKGQIHGTNSIGSTEMNTHRHSMYRPAYAGQESWM